MASAFSHGIVALAMGKAFESKELSWRELSLGALCSALPDLDVMGFYFGIQYGDVWGHRGMTHSIVFAALLAGSLVSLWYRRMSVLPRTTHSGRCQQSLPFAVSIGVFAGQQIAEKLSVGIVRRCVNVHTNSALDPVLLVRSTGQTR